MAGGWLSLILAAQAAATTAPAPSGESASFPPFDPTLFPSQIVWFIVSFGALYYVLAKFVLPKIATVLRHRAVTISGDLDAAAQKSAEAEAARAAMEKSVAKARADARAMVDAARAETQAKLSGEQEAADARLNAKIQVEEARIDSARRKALAEVPGETEKLARDIADKLAPVGVSARSAVGVA